MARRHEGDLGVAPGVGLVEGDAPVLALQHAIGALEVQVLRPAAQLVGHIGHGVEALLGLAVLALGPPAQPPVGAQEVVGDILGHQAVLLRLQRLALQAGIVDVARRQSGEEGLIHRGPQ